MTDAAIYRDDRVVVTPSIITIDGVTYPLASISSIRIEEKSNGVGPLAIAIVGVLLCASPLFFVGIILFLLALVFMLKGSRYHLIIRNASGEGVALIAKQKDYAEKIRIELERAIAGEKHQYQN